MKTFLWNYLGIENTRCPSRVVHSDKSVEDVRAILDRDIVYGVSAYTGSINSPVAEVADDFRTIYMHTRSTDTKFSVNTDT